MPDRGRAELKPEAIPLQVALDGKWAVMLQWLDLCSVVTLVQKLRQQFSIPDQSLKLGHFHRNLRGHEDLGLFVCFRVRKTELRW